jgi:hypothetical protein
MNENLTNNDYIGLLNNLKKRVLQTRNKAATSVNKELILLYYHIGIEILKSQNMYGWGAKIVDQLSQDLRTAFPE